MDKILVAREERYHHILDMIEKFKQPVVCGKINFPGANKNNTTTEEMYQYLEEILYDKFKKHIIQEKKMKGYDGSSFILSMDMEPLEIKNIAIEIEERHPLGRLFDIDVYGEEGVPISRRKLNQPARKCILCDKEAKICSRSQSHSLGDLQEKIRFLLDQYHKKEIKNGFLSI